jgi:hypothetical protein
MEKERSSSGSGLTANGFIWLAAVAAGVILVRQVPWEDSRPLGVEPKPYRYEAEQDIDARLWQDPLGAVARGRQEYRKGHESVRTDAPALDPPGHSACDLKGRIDTLRGDGRRPLIVGAMVSGGPYPDDAEVRRRARYAVLAGLSQMGFVPEDSGHLGYFTLGPPGSGRRKDLPELVAYEWFSAATALLSRSARTSNAQPPDSVLLLWLDEDIVGNAPVANVERIKEMLIGASQGVDPCTRSSVFHKTPPFVVLGPGYSSSLQAMANEAARSPARSNSSRVSFYTYGATVEDSQLLPMPAAGSAEIPASLSEFFRGRQLQVLRTIGTDDKLAEQLTEELGRRGVGPDRTTPHRDCKIREGAPPQHVILIAERDSVYSRSLPVAMERYLSRDNCNSDGRGTFATQIHHYSYLRGLDGQLPGLRSGVDGESGQKDGSDKDEKTSASARSAAEKGIERAEGQGQFDYLRRLSMRIREDVLRNGGEGQIRAIGVLGSDVYDKLVVLQALRAQFPDAIFFTTDLDARLLHPRELAWTRNLIVASSFGLHLHPELQRDIPPFRDSYQTSLYLATLVALNNAGQGKTQVDPTIIQHWFERPRLFEVGRRGPFDLSGQGDGADECEGVDKLAECGMIHPKPANMVPTPPKGSLSIVIPLLFGLVLLPVLASGAAHRVGSAVMQWAHRREPEGDFDRVRVAILVAAGVALTIGLVWADVRIDDIWQRVGAFLTQGGDGEPISLLDGVSVWPSELIRLLALALSVIFVVWGWRALDRNLDAISAELMFQPQREELAGTRRAGGLALVDAPGSSVLLSTRGSERQTHQSPHRPHARRGSLLAQVRVSGPLVGKILARARCHGSVHGVGGHRYLDPWSSRNAVPGRRVPHCR